jgi:hypothetical protein
MARASYVMRGGRLVPKHLAPPLEHQARGPQSELACPHYISDKIGDGVDGLWHPVTGEWMDSKSKFRAETEARGLTEMGNEPFPERRVQTEAELRAEVAKEIAETYDRIAAETVRVEGAKPVNSEILNVELAKNV